jgi:hypothetical protein
MMVTNTEIEPVTDRTQICKLISSVANQFHTKNVYWHMFDRLLVVCRRFLGRARELFAEREFCRELTSKWLYPRWSTAVVLMALSLLIPVHRAGAPVQPIDRISSFGLTKLWNVAESGMIRLKDRAQGDYQSLQFIYQLSRQIRNLQEQQEVCERRGTEHEGTAKGRSFYPTANAMARNRLLCSVSFDGRTRELVWPGN